LPKITIIGAGSLIFSRQLFGYYLALRCYKENRDTSHFQGGLNMREKKPNVLIFCVDEMRADHMGCAGNKVVQTPNLDRLASQGVLFKRSYCNNPICMPARASMFTGLLPRDHGVRVNGQSLRKDLPTLPGILADAGYRTHATGKLHLTPFVPKVEPPDTKNYPECLQYWHDGVMNKFPEPYYGFQTVDFVGGHTEYVYGDYIGWLKGEGGDPDMLTSQKALEKPSGAPECYKMSLPEELHYNRYISNSTIKVIKEAVKGNKPFFAWCSFPDPHSPLAPPAPYCNMYGPQDISLPPQRKGEVKDLPSYYSRVFSGEIKPNGSDNTNISDAYWQEMIALTYGMVTHIDEEIGRVLALLDKMGLKENTLIIFLADHGDMMGDHGLLWKGPYTFRGCINIPTIVSAPGIGGKGVVSNALISQIDLLPSVLGFCRIPMPGDGWKKVETPFERGSMIPLHTYPGKSWLPLLKESQSKIRQNVVIENDDPTTGYQVRCLVTEKYRLTIYPGTSEGELFDLENDKDELYNLWYLDSYSKLKTTLLIELLNSYSRNTPYYPVPPWNS